MSDPKTPDDTGLHPPRSDDPNSRKPAGDRPNDRPSDRDEAAPGTPGTGENIDPKTGETFTEGIGGA